MSLIKCPECGKEVSDKAQACIHCGYPLTNNLNQISCPSCGALNPESNDYCDECGIRITPYNQTGSVTSNTTIAHMTPAKTNSYGLFGGSIHCPKCHSEDLSQSYETTGFITKGREESRKKSAVTRAGNGLGRAGMIFATGGLWALTPKKSKYNTVQKSTSKAVRSRILTCNSCGYSWER